MHTARPHRGTGITGNLINMFIYGVDDGDNSRIRMGLGIGCIQSIDIRKKDEQIGIDETTDHSRQRIVIANFIFIDSYDIVFIDNRNNAHFQHSKQRITGIHELAPVLGVHPCQQYLAYDLAVFTEHHFIGMHEYALADSSYGLLFTNRTGPVVQVQRSQPGVGRTGTDEDHFLSLILQICQFPY